MINFIVSVQQKNGSWSYAPYDKNSFIDCFHSAFVLKNIIKTSKNIDIQFDDKVISNGYKYIKNNFFDKESNLFKRFSILNKPSLVKYDLYDNSEMLYLSKLMNDNDLTEILENSIQRFYKNDNIYSLIDLFKMQKNKNTMRWAIMPYLLARSL